jgi:16S rRNA (cytosine967-C5)-methyltransferase
MERRLRDRPKLTIKRERQQTRQSWVVSLPSTLGGGICLAAQGLGAVVDSGKAADDWLMSVSSEYRPRVQHYLYTALRWWWRSEFIVRSCLKEIPDRRFHLLLNVAFSALSDLLQEEVEEERLSKLSAMIVSQSVEAVKWQNDKLASLANAVLRRFLREKKLFDQAMVRDSGALEASFNFPAWWIRQIRQDYPDRWREMLRASRSKAPMVLRINSRKLSVEAYQEKLNALGMDSVFLGGEALALLKPVSVGLLPDFELGDVFVQDSGAQLVADWLNPQTGERILDACAAPGGKTTHLLERADCSVWAVEKDAYRMQKVTENLERLGLNDPERIQTKVADVADLAQWWDGVLFDAVLCDVPCSASGVVRRHPDIPLLRRESDIDSLVKQSQQILDNTWEVLREGGRLVMCTCSIFKRENEEVVKKFLLRHPRARLVRSQQVDPQDTFLFLQNYNDASVGNVGGIDTRGQYSDGFFFALVEKC